MQNKIPMGEFKPPIGIDFWELSCLVRDTRMIETYNWLKELERARWFADLLLSISVDLSR